jgi:hypothetical protein
VIVVPERGAGRVGNGVELVHTLGKASCVVSSPPPLGRDKRIDRGSDIELRCLGECAGRIRCVDHRSVAGWRVTPAVANACAYSSARSTKP